MTVNDFSATVSDAARSDAARRKFAAEQLSDDPDAMRTAELTRIFDLLMEEPERWDGLS